MQKQTPVVQSSVDLHVWQMKLQLALIVFLIHFVVKCDKELGFSGNWCPADVWLSDKNKTIYLSCIAQTILDTTVGSNFALFKKQILCSDC